MGLIDTPPQRIDSACFPIIAATPEPAAVFYEDVAGPSQQPTPAEAQIMAYNVPTEAPFQEAVPQEAAPPGTTDLASGIPAADLAFILDDLVRSYPGFSPSLDLLQRSPAGVAFLTYCEKSGHLQDMCHTCYVEAHRPAGSIDETSASLVNRPRVYPPSRNQTPQPHARPYSKE